MRLNATGDLNSTRIMELTKPWRPSAERQNSSSVHRPLKHMQRCSGDNAMKNQVAVTERSSSLCPHPRAACQRDSERDGETMRQSDTLLRRPAAIECGGTDTRTDRLLDSSHSITIPHCHSNPITLRLSWSLGEDRLSGCTKDAGCKCEMTAQTLFALARKRVQ